MNEITLAITILTPLLGALLTIMLGDRHRKLIICTVIAICCVATYALAALSAYLPAPGRYELSGWSPPLGIGIYIDGLACTMLLLIATVTGAIGIYALGYFARVPATSSSMRGFWPIFFFLWGSLNIIVLVADFFTLYVCLELITLAAVGGIIQEGGAAALKAGLRYLMTALMGSLAYLLGVAIVYSHTGTLDWTLVATASGPTIAIALSLLTAGLIVKTALFPLHFWLPGAHAIAAAPVSALLSSLVVKASFYVLLRLWIQVFPEEAGAAAPHFLGVLGSAAIIWGSFQAIMQRRIKSMVAYSTVAQIGYLFVAFPLLCAAANSADTAASADMWTGVVLFLVAHAIAKATLFLATGIYMSVTGSDEIEHLRGTAAKAPIATLSWGLAGISLIGLPPSGGFLAKWLLLTSAIRLSQWAYAAVILIGGLLASMYVFRVLWHAFLAESDSVERPAIPVPLPRFMPLATLFLAILIVVIGIRTTELFALIDFGSPLGSGRAYP